MNRFDAAVSGQASHDVRTVPHVVTQSGYIDWGGVQDQTWCAKLSSEGPLLCWWQIGYRVSAVAPIAFRSTLLYPGSDGVDFALLQSPVALQLLNADAVVVCVGRHFSVFNSVLNERCPGTDLLIVGELHGADTAFAVADYTVVSDDLCDVISISHLSLVY